VSATPDSTLADPQQIIANLRRERDEALAREAATAEVLQVINSSPGDLAPVFDAILEKAHALCGASSGGLVVFEGDKYKGVAFRGKPEFIQYWRRLGWIQVPGGKDNLLLQRLRRGELAHITDATIDDGIERSESYRHLVELSGARTLIVVPLCKDDALLGAITAFREEVRPFSDKQITLLQNFAAQAVIAMENARLLTETREALERQTATAEVLQVINSSPGDLKPVFDAILEKALRLCEVDIGVLWTYDGEMVQAAAIRGAPPRLAEFLRQGPHRPTKPQQRVMSGERVVQIADATTSEAYRNGDPIPRAIADLGGVRTLLIVPLRNDDAALGNLAIYRREVRPFSDKQIALLQNFAAQAVIAMENARLLTETREALEQQTATSEVLQVINRSPGELVPVFEAMLARAIRLCEAAHGHLLTYDGECFHPAADSGEPHYIEWARQVSAFSPPPMSPLGRISRGERVVHMADLREEEVYRTFPGFREQVDIRDARSQITVALVKDDTLLGAMIVYRQEVRPFTDQQIALLENFAAQAVIAMENARLLTETREALEQQTATAEVLQVINSSHGDLAPVFEAILEKAHDLCGAEHGALFMRDGERFKPAAIRDAPEPMANQLRQYGLGLDAPAVGPLLDGARFVHIPDMKDIDHPVAQAAAENGVRTLLSVPLRKDGLVGTINAVRFEVRPFLDKEISLLENFAAQAMIALENARLLGELRQRTDEVAELNRGLEARVADQVEELGRVGRLKRFLAPQLAELIVSQGDEKILESHRREIVVVFCDLRGYTAFTETAEPEEVLKFLREYHGALGPLVAQFEGTLDQFSGDGIMVFFNDPVPCPDPAERAVKMAMAMREEAGKLITAWRRDGCELGFGAGIAQGYATLGQIGFSERSGYTAIGTVCNLAARLCAEAKDGQILISSRVARAVEAVAILEDLGNLELRGLRRPVAAFNVVQSTSAADSRPNLTVVARGPGA
jgi:GAF domain-containing protein